MSDQLIISILMVMMGRIHIMINMTIPLFSHQLIDVQQILLELIVVKMLFLTGVQVLTKCLCRC